MPTGSPVTRTEAYSAHLTLDAAVLAEIEAARAAGKLTRQVQPRCHVCCESESRKLVNALLAAGLTNREIVECCEDLNARRQSKGDKRVISAASVLTHRRMHFNVDEPAMATYREIMERRAEEANQDHINGIGHAITPYAVLETVMVKGYAHVTNSETVISTKEAMESAAKLHDMTRTDAGTRRMADLLYQMDRIVRAAQEFIPPEKHEAFLAEVEGRPALRPAEQVHRVVESEPVVRTFVPPTKVDEEDSFDND